MENQPSSQPKPVTDWYRPDLSELPRLTLMRRLFRLFARGLCKLVVLVTMHKTVSGLENFPKNGPALIVINHLGDADVVLLMSCVPASIDGMGKVENDEHWLVGPTFRAYGVIGVHRGKPDRKAIRSVLDGLAEGRMIGLAPEGRQSLTGALEAGTEGAAFLAMKSGAPIVPIAMTGTQNEYIYNRKWYRRARVTLAIGQPFHLKPNADRQVMLREGTDQIMAALARLLPESYQGNYKVNQE